MFDCLHDMGDPVGAARQVAGLLAPDGTWMIVEPNAGDRTEDNFNPVGRAYYAFSTLLCTPASLSQEVGLALGAQAGEARIRDVVTAGGLTPLPARRRDALQPRLRGQALIDERTDAGAVRAREPDESGYARAADGLRLYWEIHGGGSTTIVLLPPCPISHSRIWKAQVHYLARHFRVVAYDGRGNGNSGRPDPDGALAATTGSLRLPGRDGRHGHRDRGARRHLQRRRVAVRPDRRRASGARARASSRSPRASRC